MVSKKSLHKIYESFPGQVQVLLLEILEKNFKLTLVGGVVREFFLENLSVKDIDLEIRHNDLIESSRWESLLHNLKKDLKDKYVIKELKFNIFRVLIDDYELEFSSPRLETFNDQDDLGHSDFQPTFISNLDYKKAFDRRDLTINAIGVELSLDLGKPCYKLIDPFGGVAHIENKSLENCSDDFYKDPVRLLRAIRFKINLEFDLSIKLQEQIKKTSVKKLTNYYLIYESLKSNPSVFLNYFKKECTEYPEQFNIYLQFSDIIRSSSNSKEELIIDVIQSQMYSIEKIRNFSKFLNLKIKTILKWNKFQDSILSLNQFNEVDYLFEVLDQKAIEKLKKLKEDIIFFQNKTDYPTQLFVLNEESQHKIDRIISDLEKLKSDDKYIAIYLEVDKKIRIIFSLYYIFNKLR